MPTVRDHFWLWGHEAGSHDKGYGISGTSRMTPAEGAFYLGTPNLIIVRYNDLPAPPYDQYALALSPLRRVVWSIVGAGGRTDSEEVGRARALAARFPNITGVMMDDFFKHDPTHVAVHTPESLQAIRDQLTVSGRTLDLWVVLYQQQLDLPVSAHLQLCDVVTFWTWWAERLEQLEQNFAQFERLAPTSRKVLGCYMWDYGNRKPMPVALMEHQCQLGLRWLREGRIEGMIFLASCICDMGLETVEWTREWVRAVGDEPC
ncbi:MAG: hypothetical protein HY710_15355 [Candidatus Latescibacteria bacterium]|nr:hypothetical protein [Candidatus Latescibacterota bacterium]